MFISANFVQKSTTSNHSFKSWTRWTWHSLNNFYLFAIFSGIRGKLFWSSICSIIFSPLKCSFLLILCEKSTLNDHGFSRWAWHSGKFFYLCCLHCGYLEKVVLKVQKFLWTNFFTIEMFNFANFARKINFEWSQFQKVGVTPYFCWLFSLCYWY